MRKGIMFALLLVFTINMLWAQRRMRLDDESDKASYAAGVTVASALLLQGGPGIDQEIKPEILLDALKKRLSGQVVLMDDDAAESYLKHFLLEQSQRANVGNKEAGEQFLAQNRNQPGVVETESGLQYQVIAAGDDSHRDRQHPRPFDDIVINYRAKSIDGQVFEESEEEGTWPARMIEGLKEGLQLMSTGGRYIFYIPQELAFGEETNDGKILPYSTVIYEVEMLSWEEDNDYYDEDDYIEESSNSNGHTIVLKAREAGDYQVVPLEEAGLNKREMGFEDLSVVYSSFQYGGFKILLTLDRIIVTDENNREILNRWIDNKDSDYDYYSLNVYEPKSGNYPTFFVIDMGYWMDNYYGSAVFAVENGQFVPVGILNVALDKNGDSGAINPVLNLNNRNDGVHFTFGTNDLFFNPGDKKMSLSGEDIYYVYNEGRLLEAGPVTNLSYFRRRQMTEQARRKFNDLIYHIAFGDMNGDGQEDFVLFRMDNETIYVCICKDNKWVQTLPFDLDYDYNIEREAPVVTNGEIRIYRNGSQLKRLVLDRNDKLIEKTE